jgi:uncharacterized protein
VWGEVSSPFLILNNPATPAEFPCATCHSECCGSVPLTRKEYTAILRHLRTIPRSEINRLAAQERPDRTCNFVDQASWTCSIYAARPLVCKLFGYAPKMTCKYAPLQNTRLTDDELNRQMAERIGESKGELGWITGITLHWAGIKHDLLLGPRKR